MFCTACGKEIPNEARFCNHCGGPQAAAALATASPAAPDAGPVSRGPRPSAANNLTDLHTFEWQGVCPSYKLVHTFENTTCPNDGSPTVVAFRDYRLGFYRYPFHAAELACLNDCGLRPSGFACTRCGAGIASKSIRFRFSARTRRLHLLLHSSVLLVVLSLVALVVTLVLKVPIEPTESVWRFIRKEDNLDQFGKFGAIVVSSGAVAFVGLAVLQYFRPFGRYHFGHVPRAAKKWAKEEARKESIQSARAVESDRKLRESWSIDGVVDGLTGKK